MNELERGCYWDNRHMDRPLTVIVVYRLVDKEILRDTKQVGNSMC